MLHADIGSLRIIGGLADPVLLGGTDLQHSLVFKSFHSDKSHIVGADILVVVV